MIEAEIIQSPAITAEIIEDVVEVNVETPPSITLDIVTGEDGESAYETAVRNGFQGTESEWLASLVGPEGPPGFFDGPGAYVHEQMSPSIEWLVQHDLNMYPAVTIVDSAGTVVEGSIEYLTKQTVRLSFSGAFAGRAFFS